MALSRRSFLMGGAAALAATALPLSRSAQADATRAPRNLILILAYGGWDTTYALDPKPGLAGIDVPAGAIQTFDEIPIWAHSSRPKVSSFFGAHAGMCAVVNGIQVQSIVHPDCTKRMLTGTASDANPDVGAITAFELGRDLPAPYLVLGPTAYTGPLASISARAGTVNQIRTLLDPNLAFPGPSQRFAPSPEEQTMMRDYVLARVKREEATRGQYGYNAARFDDFKMSLARGDVLKGFSGGFGDDFEFTLGISEQIQIGLQALQTGVCHSLHLEQAFAQWDTHAYNPAQGAMHEELYGALHLLANELVARPGKNPGARMIDETVVAVVSDMGRTPQLNGAGGKDHWPVTSALVFGGGVAGGRVYGRSGDGLEALSVDLATGQPDPNGKQLAFGNFAAGLLELVGVDASNYLPNSEPFRAFQA